MLSECVVDIFCSHLQRMRLCVYVEDIEREVER